VKKSFFGTMLFPNFYVPSVRLAVVEFLAFPHEFIASWALIGEWFAI
jgi:hypothetical protein